MSDNVQIKFTDLRSLATDTFTRYQLLKISLHNSLEGFNDETDQAKLMENVFNQNKLAGQLIELKRLYLTLTGVDLD